MRLPDWEARLEAFFQENKSRKFQYGSWDCCLMTAAAIEAMTGKHPGEQYVGAYHNMATSRALCLQIAGDVAMRHAWRKVMRDAGYAEQEANFAQRGDPVLLVRGGRDHSVGLIALNGQIAVVTKRGIEYTRRSQAVTSWRV